MLDLKITDSDILKEGEPKYISRISKYGSRGVLFNKKGQITLMYVSDADIFKLPGGKVEDNETPEEAFKREIKEETGYDCHNLTFLGTIEEHKLKKDFLHISYCYHAEAIGKKRPLKLTREEKRKGYKPYWFDYNIAEMIIDECIEKCNDYRTLFVLNREKAILSYVREIIKIEDFHVI